MVGCLNVLLHSQNYFIIHILTLMKQGTVQLVPGQQSFALLYSTFKNK